MHIYQPHEHDRIGWSPPQKKEPGGPSKVITSIVMILMTLVGMAGVMFWLTLGEF